MYYDYTKLFSLQVDVALMREMEKELGRNKAALIIWDAMAYFTSNIEPEYDGKENVRYFWRMVDKIKEQADRFINGYSNKSRIFEIEDKPTYSVVNYGANKINEAQKEPDVVENFDKQVKYGEQAQTNDYTDLVDEAEEASTDNLPF